MSLLFSVPWNPIGPGSGVTIRMHVGQEFDGSDQSLTAIVHQRCRALASNFESQVMRSSASWKEWVKQSFDQGAAAAHKFCNAPNTEIDLSKELSVLWPELDEAARYWSSTWASSNHSLRADAWSAIRDFIQIDKQETADNHTQLRSLFATEKTVRSARSISVSPAFLLVDALNELQDFLLPSEVVDQTRLLVDIMCLLVQRLGGWHTIASRPPVCRLFMVRSWSGILRYLRTPGSSNHLLLVLSQPKKCSDVLQLRLHPASCADQDGKGLPLYILVVACRMHLAPRILRVARSHLMEHLAVCSLGAC